MEMRRSDSSGTDDDLPPSLMPRSNNSRSMAVNGKPRAANGSSKSMDQLIRVLEQDAYTAVLRAFGAQSENISWAKERLISDLRKELRVTDELHRELLAKVGGDESLRHIRDLRQLTGNDQPIPASSDAPPHPLPLLPQPRKKQKTGAVSHQATTPAAPPPPPPAPPASAPVPAPKSFSKKGGGAAAAPRGKSKGSSDKISLHGRGPSQSNIKKKDAVEDRWVGQFIKMRWPDDNNFYEAFVRDYHKEDGTHTVVYDMGTEKETSERVDLSKMAPEDIQSNGKHQPGKKSSSTDRHHGSKKRIEKSPLSSQQKWKGGERKYKLPSVESLVQQVQELEHDADPSKIEHVKRLAKEHEESLRRALEEVGETSDEEDDDGGADRHKSMNLVVNGDSNRD